jgi:N-acetylmuramoyl-L-alanine amidase
LTNRGIFLENDLARCARGGSQLYIHDMNAPAALIEMAFLDTDSDRELMVNQQDAFARAIADAVMGYLGK